MKLDASALQAGDGASLLQLDALCRECARKGAYKVGALSFADDIAQEMMLHVLHRFLAVYDGERDVEPYLIEVGRRLGLGFIRRHSKEMIFGMTEEGANPLDRMVDADPIADEMAMQDEIDAKARVARQTLIERMRGKKRVQSVKHAEIPPPTKSAIPTATVQSDSRAAINRRIRAARKEVVEINRIRRRIGYTHEQLAKAIGRTPNTVRTLQYGAVHGDPKTVLAEVRALEERLAFDATVPIWKRLREWCERLGIDHESEKNWHIALGELIGVHRATMYRWRTGKTQPMPHVMRALDSYVDGLANARHA